MSQADILNFMGTQKRWLATEEIVTGTNKLWSCNQSSQRHAEI